MKERPRVLLLADSPYFGGITTHLMSIARSMAGSPFEICMATLPGRRDDTALIDACRREKTPIHEFRMSHAFDLAVLSQLRRHVVENGIRLVHTHNYRATLLARLARAPVPIVNTCHGAAAERSLRVKGWQWAELMAIRRNRLTIACSDYVRRWLEARGLNGGRIRTIRNGYAAPADVKPVTRAEAGVPEPDLLAFYAGRLCDGKGLEYLVDAVSGMAGVTVLIAGDGPQRAELERRAQAAGSRVRFLGQMADPGPFYRLADVVVLASRMEALPMTLIEAAAFGRPSIATGVGGVPEVVEPGESGLLVGYGDVNGLRDALEQMKDMGTRESMGGRARQIWEERFTPERFAEELSKAYAEALV
ncbi:MAG: glycosyltransferase family 4 protein [Candidatus Hydrogenedentes bacterium]|nr:glycosyltransferase family 4 protein [Candidatus Hydrogenedentota bacterium]